MGVSPVVVGQPVSAVLVASVWTAGTGSPTTQRMHPQHGITFADKMTFPQGAAWLDGSLYVMSPPGLWKLTDTTGSGVADKREMLMSGFDYSGNAADVHGPFAHPNGRLYWCHRRNGHKDVSIAHAAGNALAMKPTTDATPALLHRITGELYRSVEHQVMFALITAGDAKTIAAAFRHDHTPALKHRVLTVVALCFGVASTWMFEV